MSDDPPIRDAVLEALGSVSYPGFQRDIVSMGMLRDLRIEHGTVTVRLAPGSGNEDAVRDLVGELRQRVGAVDGVAGVEVLVEQPSSGPQGGPSHAGHSHAGPGGPAQAQPVEGVRRVVAVASGKGGVGKSTVAVNLAAALSARGDAVGLLDADIYGPSVPTMLGIHQPPEVADRRIQPVERHGLRTLSMGFFVEPDQAVIWRGPMVMKAIQQFVRDADWGELDWLVVDLPPGTGDAQLTMVQLVELAGAVVVTTPQEVALADVRKAVGMFHKTETPILGVVENMSHFVCPGCGEDHDIFSRGGGRREAERLGVPFLGEVPITPALRRASDEGSPLVLSEPDDPASRAFARMAEEISDTLAEASSKGGFWPFRRG